MGLSRHTHVFAINCGRVLCVWTSKMATAQTKKRSISPESGKSRSAKSKKKRKEDEETATETTKYKTRHTCVLFQCKNCVFLPYNYRSQDRHVTKKEKKEKKKPSHSSSSKHKVRNITELAKLVSSGKVSVPQSLAKYTEERLLLLDQLFTILTPDDIRGMLPDILKVCIWGYSTSKSVQLWVYRVCSAYL